MHPNESLTRMSHLLGSLGQGPSENVLLGVLRVEELRRQRTLRCRMTVFKVNGAHRDLGRGVRIEIELWRERDKNEETVKRRKVRIGLRTTMLFHLLRQAKPKNRALETGASQEQPLAFPDQRCSFKPWYWALDNDQTLQGSRPNSISDHKGGCEPITSRFSLTK